MKYKQVDGVDENGNPTKFNVEIPTSKGLEALNEIEKFIEKNLSKTKDNESFNLGFDIGIIEKELKEYEGAKNHIEALHKERVENALKLKALEIIKNKWVNVLYFRGCSSLEEYNSHHASWYKLTQEEYELLKEVLL